MANLIKQQLDALLNAAAHIIFYNEKKWRTVLSVLKSKKPCNKLALFHITFFCYVTKEALWFKSESNSYTICYFRVQC